MNARDDFLRVLFFPRYERLGSSSRLRCYQYLPRLEAFGIRADLSPLLSDDYVTALYSGRKRDFPITSIASAYIERIADCIRKQNIGLVWIERELLPWIPEPLERMIRGVWRVPYVVDLDDAVFHRYDRHRREVVRKLLGGKIDGLMRGAGMVVVGNDYLAARAIRAGARRVEYLPTVVDVARYSRSIRARSDVVTIGWIGTPETVHFLEVARDALHRVARKHRIRLLTIGAEVRGWTGVPSEAAPWSEDTEASLLAEVDIGIMPLTDGLYERGKCGYKLIQYMAAGAPVIASPVGVNRELVQQNVNGFLATDTTSWTGALDALIGNPELRSAMGDCGRRLVMEKYSLESTSTRFAELLWRAGLESAPPHKKGPACIVNSAPEMLVGQPAHAAVPGTNASGDRDTTVAERSADVPRILHVFGDSAFGGAARNVACHVVAQKSEGWDVEVLTTCDEFARFLATAGVRVRSIDAIWRNASPIRDAWGLIKLVRFLRRNRYTIVHTHTSKAGIVGRLAAKLARTPIIFHTMHGLAIHERSNPILIKMVALIERFAATCCDRVITVSSFHRRWSLALNIASPSKITAIPNGVPCTETDGEYASTLREVMGASGPDHFVLLYSGRLAPGKGLETLLRAMPLIIDRLGERVRCVFVGEGPIRSALERLSRRLGVASQVIFLGFRHDVGDLLRASDAFILASEREGMSISLLEAMAAGKPIIATDIASNREATDNGEAARLVRVGHAGDIADAVVTLANDRDLCLNIGSRARELWRERYTLPSAIASLQSLYREALANRHTTVSTSIGATRHAAKPSPKTSALLD